MHSSAFISQLFWWLYYAWIASEVVIAVATRTGKTGGSTHDRGSQAILWIVIVASATACFFIANSQSPNIFPDDLHARRLLRAAALLVLILGLAVRWTAILTLGRAFSANVAIRDAQQLRTTGLYSVIRHPSYLGMEIIFLAIGLFAGNWLALAFIIIPTTAAVLYRIHVEEIALRSAFGQQYADYARTTKRLIPGIY
jgi:protein-S-isoprenylcysteine O-methyltransferase Ste14